MVVITLSLVGSVIFAVLLGMALSVLPSDLGLALTTVLVFDLLAIIIATSFGFVGKGISSIHASVDHTIRDSLTPRNEDTEVLFLHVYLRIGLLFDLLFFSFAFLLPSQFWLGLLSQPFSPLAPVWTALTNLVVRSLGQVINPVILIASPSVGPALLFLIRDTRRKRSLSLSRFISVIPYVTYVSFLIWLVSLSQGQSIPDIVGPPSLFGLQFWLYLLRFVVVVLPSATFSSLVMVLLEGRKPAVAA